jgi:hypothetical protein
MFNAKTAYQNYAKAMNSQKVADPKVCRKVMAAMAKESPELFDKVNQLAEETTFNVRKYGNAFFCYPQHKELKCKEPWPANRYPKASLCVQFAIELQN